MLSEERLAWYESGVMAGITIGRQQAEDEQQAWWSAMAAKVRALGKPNAHSFAELCAIRGEPEREQRARRQTERVMA